MNPLCRALSAVCESLERQEDMSIHPRTPTKPLRFSTRPHRIIPLATQMVLALITISSAMLPMVCAEKCAHCRDCDLVTGLCPKGCFPGYYGPTCDLTCCANGETHLCDQSSGKCQSCRAPFYGHDCLSECAPGCFAGHCLQDSGECNGCVPGLWGYNCENSCGGGCGGECIQADGRCIGNYCGAPYWGLRCDKPCTKECLPYNPPNLNCLRETGCCRECPQNLTGCHCQLSQDKCFNKGPCSFYANCLEPEMSDQCPFIQDVMIKKCKAFLKLEPSLSPVGQKWSSTVRTCLQDALYQQLTNSGQNSESCDVAKQVFLDAHIRCYLGKNQDSSFCRLPAHDKWAIVKEGTDEVTLGFVWKASPTGAVIFGACENTLAEILIRCISSKRAPQVDLTSLQDAINLELSNHNWTASFVSNQTRRSSSNFNQGLPQIPSASEELGIIIQQVEEEAVARAQAVLKQAVINWALSHIECLLELNGELVNHKSVDPGNSLKSLGGL